MSYVSRDTAQNSDIEFNRYNFFYNRYNFLGILFV